MWMLLLYTLYVFIAHMHVMMSCGTGHKEITIHLVALYLEQSYIVNQLVM